MDSIHILLDLFRYVYEFFNQFKRLSRKTRLRIETFLVGVALLSLVVVAKDPNTAWNVIHTVQEVWSNPEMREVRVTLVNQARQNRLEREKAARQPAQLPTTSSK